MATASVSDNHDFVQGKNSRAGPQISISLAKACKNNIYGPLYAIVQSNLNIARFPISLIKTTPEFLAEYTLISPNCRFQLAITFLATCTIAILFRRRDKLVTEFNVPEMSC